ncbi:MAG: glycine cleavage system protein T [Acidobacteria bacterium]|nr:glycine cleavage system protein T [Acidobacteriota bacterium]
MEFAPRIAMGPRVRKSPYFEATKRYGVKSFTIYNHMFMPTGYTDPVDEYWSLVNDVTIWDVACERQIEITGPDASRFAQYLTPRNLSRCAPGQALYVLLTGPDGGIINDAVLLRLREDQYWISPGDGDVLLWAQGAALNSGMKVTITEPDVSPLQICGPKSPQVLKTLFGDWALELKYYRLKETDVNGIPVVLARTGWSGEINYEIYLRDGSRGEELWERVMEAGKPYNIVPTGPSDIRRIEAGILNYGIDMTLENNPYEVGLGWQVEDQDSDYMGKAALERIAEEGVSRKLVGMEIEGDPVDLNMARWPVSHEGREVGFVSSAVYSPRLEKNIGYAWVPAELAELGMGLTVSVPELGDCAATIVPRPFVDPKKEIPKS